VAWRYAYLIPALMLGALWSCRAQCPLPPDVSISLPGPEVPADIAAFSGAWGGGAWGGELPTFLVVESVNADGTAKIVYSYGKSPRFDAGWTRIDATIAGGHMHMTPSRGVTLDFWIDGDGSLYGLYTIRRHPSSVELHRLAIADAASIRAEAAKPVPSAWTEIEIPEHSLTDSNAGDLKLQATLYRNPQPGRHPLIIFCHGSTGPGVIPASLVDRAWELALVCRPLGYSVVVAMRKGRGKSGGKLIEEEDDDPKVQLAAATEDLDAVVAFMRREPYVDPSRIVLAGQSRGGFLAVVYAGEHPRAVEGVVNFSGGWFSQDSPDDYFNGDQFRKAGNARGPPMLWLCAERDSLYSPAYVAHEFSDFKAAGGIGQLLTFDNIPGEGHFLIAWPQRWRAQVTAYLAKLHTSPAEFSAQ